MIDSSPEEFLFLACFRVLFCSPLPHFLNPRISARQRETVDRSVDPFTINCQPHNPASQQPASIHVHVDVAESWRRMLGTQLSPLFACHPRTSHSVQFLCSPLAESRSCEIALITWSSRVRGQEGLRQLVHSAERAGGCIGG